MFGYAFWSAAALFGAVWTIKYFFVLSTYKKHFKAYVLYAVIHAILLSGACVMALGLFNIALPWLGKLVILAVVFLHNGLILWQVNLNEK